MGQTRDRIPWWLTATIIWAVVFTVVVGLIGGAAWFIVWLIGVV